MKFLRFALGATLALAQSEAVLESLDPRISLSPDYAYLSTGNGTFSAIPVSGFPPNLSRRQTSMCATGRKVCGDGCIPLSYTCCVDKLGGCDPTTVCWKNPITGTPGCCPIGKTCTSGGGINNVPGGGTDSSSTLKCIASQIECGDACIPSTYTCCADKLGGCPSTHYCQTDPVSGKPGCCSKDTMCSGGGGFFNTISTSPLPTGVSSGNSDDDDVINFTSTSTTSSSRTSTRTSAPKPTIDVAGDIQDERTSMSGTNNASGLVISWIHTMLAVGAALLMA